VKILLAGAPGAGKGTQGSLLAQRLGVPHIASGDLVRGHIERATPDGRTAQAAAERRDLVDDDVLLRMIAPSLEHAGRCGGFVLDGYPRTVAQARHVEQTSAFLDVVMHLVVPRERLRQRLLARGRPDDTADVIDHRLEVYAQLTAPLLDTFAAEGRLVLVDGTGTVDRVTGRIGRELRAWRLRRAIAG
jgi:adenylate kinase